MVRLVVHRSNPCQSNNGQQILTMPSHNPQTCDSTAADSSISGRIMQIRQMQAELRTRPVTGTFRALKRVFYKAVRATFARQFNLNAATVDLLEAVYREIGRNSAEPRQQASAPNAHGSLP